MSGARDSEMAPLERWIGVVLRVGVMASSACLAIGLVLELLNLQSGFAGVLLHTGIIVLLATPVARVIVSVGQYVRARDWAFVALTMMVLVELIASVVAALVLNRRV